MCSPFEPREDWRVTAVKFRGTIYLHKEETREQRDQRERRTPRQRAMCSWGYKFEERMLGDTPSEAAGAPVSDSSTSSSSSSCLPVNESEEFCCVFRTRLGKHSVVFGAEMDGLVVSVSRGEEGNECGCPSAE